jgi:hypothetical protein
MLVIEGVQGAQHTQGGREVGRVDRGSIGLIRRHTPAYRS